MSVGRKRVGIAAVLCVLVIARSAVFVAWPHSHFDSDQAVTGLMAKHLSELRAFPVFWYGQTYMLGVEAWLAAPLMAIFGASGTVLKLPLLVMNVGIALLLFIGLTRDAGLEDVPAAFATGFFVLAAPITAAHFLTANGGNVEPCLYVLLLWFLRRRAVWFGVVLGIGFLNREFTIYGAAALLIVEASRRTLFTREATRRYAVAFGTAAAVWVAVLMLRHFSSAAGPGTTTADLSATLAGNNLLQVAERLCLDVAAMIRGAGSIVTVHWPELFGLESQPLTDFGIESAVRQGFRGSALLLLPVLGIPVMRLAWWRVTRHDGQLVSHRAACEFCLYLLMVAALSLTGYLVGRCGMVDFYTMRYELLSVPGAVGLAGWYLRIERSRPWRAMWMLACAAVFALSIAGHARLVVEYVEHRPAGLKQGLIHELEARHVRYAYADFWTAYYVSFMSRERIVVASDDVVKVRTYNRVVDAHRDEAIRISRRPCPTGEPLTPAFWSCRP